MLPQFVDRVGHYLALGSLIARADGMSFSFNSAPSFEALRTFSKTVYSALLRNWLIFSFASLVATIKGQTSISATSKGSRTVDQSSQSTSKVQRFEKSALNASMTLLPADSERNRTSTSK